MTERLQFYMIFGEHDRKPKTVFIYKKLHARIKYKNNIVNKSKFEKKTITVLII